LRAQRRQVAELVFRIPLLAQADAPAVAQHQLDVADQRRAGRIGVADAGQLHPLRIEIADLAEAGGQPLAPAVLLQQTRRDRDRGLVRIHLPIGAAEAVGAEQLGEAEGQFLRIEQRQVVLVLVGHAQVVQTRLERLQHLPPEQARRALEHQARVEARDRGAARRRVRFERRQVFAIEVVAGVAITQFRTQVPRGALDRERDIGVQVVTRRARPVVVIERDRFAAHPGEEPVLQRLLVTEQHARQAPERLEAVGQERIGDGPVLRADARAPVAATAEQSRGALQQARARRRQRVAEVLEVAIVRHGVDVRAHVPLRAEAAVVPEAERAAVVAGAVVVRQPGAGDLAAVVGSKITELARDHRAALGEQARRHGQVVVRCEVDVVGRGDVDAAVLRTADAREQEAGATSLVDRETRIRQVQDRHRPESQRRVACGADAFGLVEVDARGAQLPAGRARIAGRVDHAIEHAGLALHHRPVGATVAACLEQLVAHLLQRIAVLAQFALGARGTQQQAAVLVVDVAFGLVAIGLRVVAQRVGGDVLVGALDLDRALERVDLAITDVEPLGTEFRGRALALALARQIGAMKLEQGVRTAQRPGRGIVAIALHRGHRLDPQTPRGEQQGMGEGGDAGLRHGVGAGQNGGQHAAKRSRAATRPDPRDSDRVHAAACPVRRQTVPFRS
jgi:hypothetical protein